MTGDGGDRLRRARALQVGPEACAHDRDGGRDREEAAIAYNDCKKPRSGQKLASTIVMSGAMAM